MLSPRFRSRLWLRPRWLWLTALLLLLILAGCKESSPDPSAATRIAGVLQNPCGPETTDAVIEALARSGIETYDDATGLLIMNVIPPARGLHVTRTQARGMGCEVASHGGTTGEQLDLMVGPLPLPDNSQLPVSALFAAYASTPGAFGSELAIVLMGNIDGKAPSTLVFPSIVITTFLREVVVPMLAEAPAADWHGPAGQPVTTRAADPCAAISQFLDDLPSAVSNAVGSLSPEEGSFWPSVFSVAAKIAGAVTYATVAAAKTFVQHLPGMDALRKAMTAVGVVVDLRCGTQPTCDCFDAIKKSCTGSGSGCSVMGDLSVITCH